jgi:hypothetical protein
MDFKAGKIRRLGTMKILLASCMLVLLGTAAQAHLTPLHRQAPDTSSDTWAISTRPAGAMLESDYFQPPSGAFASQRIAPCQTLRNIVNGEVHITHLCH